MSDSEAVDAGSTDGGEVQEDGAEDEGNNRREEDSSCSV